MDIPADLVDATIEHLTEGFSGRICTDCYCSEREGVCPHCLIEQLSWMREGGGRCYNCRSTDITVSDHAVHCNAEDWDCVHVHPSLRYKVRDLIT